MIRKYRFLVFFLLIGLLPIVSGCAPGTPFGQSIPVDNLPAKALSDGLAKEKAVTDKTFAPSYSEVDKERALAPLYNDAVAYYGAVARKFPGTDTAVTASLAEARLQDKGLKTKDAALRTLRAAIVQYPGSTELKDAELELVGQMDAENSTKPGYKVLDFLVKLLGNNPSYSYVLAIVAISLSVTLALWPLRAKYYGSMKEIQRYQPEMARIREKYKDDAALQRDKMMEFSLKHGINQKTMIGCVPLILQWPVLWGLWASINQYQFQFAKATFLWVNPAAATAWSKISFPPPFDFLHGAVAPSLGQQDLFLLLFYAGSMFVQMKMTPATDPSQAEQQRMMAVMMPGVFFIMMLQWHLPSAFVLYWFLSNILTVSQQWYITKNIPPMPPLEFGDEGSAASPPKSGGGGGQPAPVTANGSGKPMSSNPRLVSPKSRRKKQ